MKRILGLILIFLLCFSGCGNGGKEMSSLHFNSPGEHAGSAVQKEQEASQSVSETSQTESNITEEENIMLIEVNGHTFTAELAENSSAEALKERLADGPLTLDMHDYANFEKVGPLDFDLPTNDEQISTGPGDLILYQGNQFTFYYGKNAWNFTRLGHVEGYTTEELKAIFGDGDVTMTLSLPDSKPDGE